MPTDALAPQLCILVGARSPVTGVERLGRTRRARGLATLVFSAAHRVSPLRPPQPPALWIARHLHAERVGERREFEHCPPDGRAVTRRHEERLPVQHDHPVGQRLHQPAEPLSGMSSSFQLGRCRTQESSVCRPVPQDPAPPSSCPLLSGPEPTAWTAVGDTGRSECLPKFGDQNVAR